MGGYWDSKSLIQTMEERKKSEKSPKKLENKGMRDLKSTK
jgi:hypothetical protein